MGRIIVHLYGKPKDQLIANIIENYSKRVKNNGISLQFYSDKKNKLDYEQNLIKLKGNLILIDENGEQISSIKLSELLSKFLISSESTNFAVGPPDGFSNDIKSKISKSISLSTFTLTHEMAAVIIMEQLYRSTEILKGTQYHRN